MEHITDSDFSDPFVPPGTESSQFIPNSEALATIISMGFTQGQAVKALKATDNNVERAMDWIFSHQDELDNVTSPAPPEFRDGDGSM
jgi:ubiquitin carboxyl-terminal hydrolase 5/13